MNEIKTALEIYNDAITLLDVVELVVQDELQFLNIRKRILNIANDVKRLGDLDG